MQVLFTKMEWSSLRFVVLFSNRKLSKIFATIQYKNFMSLETWSICVARNFVIVIVRLWYCVIVLKNNNFLFQSHKGNHVISQSPARTLIAVTGVTICLVVLIKWYFGGGVCKSKARLDGKIHHSILSTFTSKRVNNLKGFNSKDDFQALKNLNKPSLASKYIYFNF